MISAVDEMKEVLRQVDLARAELRSRGTPFADEVQIGAMIEVPAAVEIASPSREEIHAMIGNAPSLRHVSELAEGAVRGLESQWHKIYIAWHSVLGQLKVKQRAEEQKTFWSAKK